MILLVNHVLGRVLSKLEQMGDRLAIKWYPVLFDIVWQEGFNGEINDLSWHCGMWGWRRWGCFKGSGVEIRLDQGLYIR